MKKWLLFVVFMLVSQSVWAQPGSSASQQNFGLYIAGRVVPTRCTAPSVFTAWTGVVYSCQANVYVAIGVGSGGTVNPNQLPTLLTGTSGLDVNWELDVSSVTLNVPDASCTARGAMTPNAQVFCGPKTFNEEITAPGLDVIGPDPIIVLDLSVCVNYGTIVGKAILCANTDGTLQINGLPVGGGSFTSVDGEVPTGDINSSNQSFTLAHNPDPDSSLHCYGNGLRWQAGGVDFTLSGTGITTVGTLQTGGKLVCDYRY